MNDLNLKPGSIIRHECENCGNVHIEIPQDAKPYMTDDNKIFAWSFPCKCGSHMYVKNYSKLEK